MVSLVNSGRMKVIFLLIYICNFHVLSHLLLIYICKLHWNRFARMKAGKGPIGYLNPAIYKFAHKFARDVTEGDNHCAAGDCTLCCGQGFSSTKGFFFVIIFIFILFLYYFYIIFKRLGPCNWLRDDRFPGILRNHDDCRPRGT